VPRQPRKVSDQTPVLDEDELARRMRSSAGRKLEERLRAAGWGSAPDASDPGTAPDET
jgi:hypothetical protein